MKFVMAMTLALIWNFAFAQEGKRMATAEEVIKKLNLQPLDGEGGYYKQTYKSDEPVLRPAEMEVQSASSRQLSTAIYYMVVPGNFSALHRLTSVEIFHFYAGDPVEMLQIDPQGKATKFILGPDILRGQTPQVVVPRGSWQGTRLRDGGKWALMGTTVSPGFEYEDFELGAREDLIKAFPQHRDDIIRFTREPHEKAH
jgi:uncharacterized protein